MYIYFRFFVSVTNLCLINIIVAIAAHGCHFIFVNIINFVYNYDNRGMILG